MNFKKNTHKQNRGDTFWVCFMQKTTATNPWASQHWMGTRGKSFAPTSKLNGCVYVLKLSKVHMNIFIHFL